MSPAQISPRRSERLATLSPSPQAMAAHDHQEPIPVVDDIEEVDDIEDGEEEDILDDDDLPYRLDVSLLGEEDEPFLEKHRPNPFKPVSKGDVDLLVVLWKENLLIVSRD